MGTRESHAPGTFSWVDLATPDAAGAKAFYSALFGWSYDDRPMDDQGNDYSMAQLEGRTAAALFETRDQPPHWNCYVTVASADETAGKVEEAGGTLLAPAFDVFTAGRMAVVQDPAGAVLSVWEAKDSIGSELVNVPGALTWNDLMTTDVAAATGFYGALFGWEFGEVEGAPDDRVVIRNGERMNGGMAKLPESASGLPPHWLPYFAVEDVETAVETVRSNGGEVLFGPIEVPAGAIAACADPQGAAFALFSGELDD